MRYPQTTSVVLLWLGLLASTGQAQQPTTPPVPDTTSQEPSALALPFAILGPPPPAPPATVARDAQGGVTARAVRLATPLRIDGQLNEAFYGSTPALSDFIQNEPTSGAPATEKTEVWVAFDDAHVYVGIRAWESQPDRMVVNEMRRDSQNIWQNGSVSFMFDTYYDRRNAVSFDINALGGRGDTQITDERVYNSDWNPIWDLSVGTFEGGWTVEAAIPFKSLRYRPGRAQVWGFNARRVNKWKNEISFLTRVADGLGSGGIAQASQAATLVGIEAPPGSRNLDLKPYVISDLATDATATPRINNDPGGAVGLDVKYGLTQNLTADFTYNTDFAQVEARRQQQVDLTRFSLFFPEKREFFLENQGLFRFGGAQGFGAVPFLFHSRRIGLDRGREIPIQAGGRLTGRVGAFDVGVLNIQTDDKPAVGAQATNFSVVRARRDILRRSSVGALFTRRSVSLSGVGSNETYGLDGRFSFYEHLTFDTLLGQDPDRRIGRGRHELSRTDDLRRRPLRDDRPSPRRREAFQPGGRVSLSPRYRQVLHPASVQSPARLDRECAQAELAGSGRLLRERGGAAGDA